MTHIELKATEHKVHAVTVFGADRAEVIRLFTVPLKAGQNEIDISQLPTRLDEDSIRVDGIGGNGGSTIISDVIYHPPSSNDSDKKHENAVRDLQRQKENFQRKLEVFHKQASILETYAKTLKGEDTDGLKLEEFLEIYATRQSSIDTNCTELKEKIAAIDEEIKVERQKWNADNEGKRRAVRITIMIQAEQDGPAEISLTYLVANAFWTPLYDLRAVIGPTKTAISLHYRATIQQATGEDWKEVALTLSTASPQVGSTIPKLTPQWISTLLPASFWIGKRKSSNFGGSVPLSSAKSPEKKEKARRRLESDEEDEVGGGGFGVHQALAVEGAVSTSYIIEGLSTIPTNTDSASQAHKVNVALIDLLANLEWVAIPKEIPSAFLQAKVKNTSGYLLLPGRANIFLDNNFVAKSEIGHVSPSETFNCSLGVDSQIKITYHPRTKKARSQGGLLSSRASITAFSQKITVKNTRSSSVKRLIVRDQIPISSDQRIKIALVEPAVLESSNPNKANSGSVSEKTLKVPNLNSNSKGKEVPISKNISVRWKVGEEEEEASDAASTSAHSQTHSSDEAREGILEWICELGSGQSTDIILAWEVTAPAGINWA